MNRLMKRYGISSATGGLLIALLSAPLVSLLPVAAQACGGFFCQTLPIDQAGEQIVFRQEGSTVTAMVRILYTGEAEDFSWVVPVPSRPELSTGSDTLFDQLDFQTRPQFILERRGQECARVFASTDAADGDTSSAESSTDGSSVMVEESVVGPFAVQLVTSDEPGALATWLVDNGYQLNERGEELIEPYVTAGMTFVALKLRSGQSSGSIEPLIMRYQSENPVIPIRLTAIAAEEDMGVLVWVVADQRAVPDNYLHVIPNYGRLNWFSGPTNAYASYQALITAAMDEAGGQGFATDYAGPVTASITQAFSDPDDLQRILDSHADTSDDAFYIASVLSQMPQQQSLDFLQAALPPPGGFDQFVYFDPVSMRVAFSDEQLTAARASYQQFIVDRVIAPLREAITLIPAGTYMTRLYTTLSPEDMTVDPAFVYNSGMPEQSVNREALLDMSCTDEGTQWTLTLGAGTGRDGEVVAEGLGVEAPFAPLPEVTAQRAVFRTEDTSADSLPVLVSSNAFETVISSGDGSSVSSGGGSSSASSDDGFLGAGSVWLLGLVGFAGLYRRRHATGKPG